MHGLRNRFYGEGEIIRSQQVKAWVPIHPCAHGEVFWAGEHFYSHIGILSFLQISLLTGEVREELGQQSDLFSTIQAGLEASTYQSCLGTPTPSTWSPCDQCDHGQLISPQAFPPGDSGPMVPARSLSRQPRGSTGIIPDHPGIFVQSNHENNTPRWLAC